MSKTIDLPETVAICPVCRGYGAYVQRFLEGKFTETCDMCGGAQFVYCATSAAVPESVRRQIAVANDMEERQPMLAGIRGPLPLWPIVLRDEIDDCSLVPRVACYEIKTKWPAPATGKAKT